MVAGVCSSGGEDCFGLGFCTAALLACEKKSARGGLFQKAWQPQGQIKP
jgi:hypothetical protein